MNYVIEWEWLDFRTEWGYLQMNSLWWIEIEKTNKNLIFRYKHLVEADLNITNNLQLVSRSELGPDIYFWIHTYKRDAENV